MEAGEGPANIKLPESPKHNGKRDAPPEAPQLATAKEDNSDSDEDISAKCIGPYKQLWTVLLGKAELVDLEIVHDQLKYRRNDLLAVYMYQKKTFTAIPLRENASVKDMVANALANKWMVPESVALEVFMDYIVFEYNGVVKAVSELLADIKVYEKIMTEVDNFFRTERLCKLYCTQVILGQATDESKPYNQIFAEFITSPGTLENWTETICLSFVRASNDEERVQILHTLTVLLVENAEFEDVLHRFVENYKPPEEFRNSKSILLAEALLMYAFLQCGLDNKNRLITTYLNKYGMDVLENKYLLGAYITAYKDRCQEHSEVGNFIRRAPNPEKCVQSMIELLEEYDVDSYRNKHGLSDIIARAVAFAAEIIMGNYNKEFFGRSADWLKLLCRLMKNPTIAATFLRDQPRELFSLYEDYSNRFPVDAESILQCWGAVVTGGSRTVAAPEILQDFINMMNISERFDDIEFVRVKQPEQEWETTQNRHILGVTIPAGTTATMIENDATPKLLVWNVAPSIHAVDVWKVYYELLCNPAAEAESLDMYYASLEVELKLACTATDFIIAYFRQSTNIPEHMLEFSNVVADVLLRHVFNEQEKTKKSKLLGLYISLVQSLSAFDSQVFLTRASGLLPSPEEDTLISRLILCLESLADSDLSVSLAFLEMIGTLFRSTLPKSSPFNIGEEMPPPFKSYYVYAISFICENILPGLLRWRIIEEERRHELFIRCLRIFVNLFSVHDKWTGLKNLSCNELVGPKSPLLYILTTTDEYAIQESLIKTSPTNRQVPIIVDIALNLIVKLATYKREVLHALDNHSGLAMVQKLGRMLRHRVNTSIPILSVLLLKKFAEESNMSMLCCLGEDVEPFCDHVIQRLEFKAEDTQLKACILDFLTVCAQTQVALIHRLMDENSQDALLDQVFGFLTESDSNLVVASCSFIRALVVMDNNLLKKYKANIWSTIFVPIKEISKFLNKQVRKKIIATTLNSISYEIHRRGCLDPNFDNELRDLFRGSQWSLITEAALEGKDDETIKCVLAIKHFLILLHGSKEVNSQLHFGGPLQTMLEQITEAFWLEKEFGDSSVAVRTTLAEIMVVLAPSAPEQYLESFCQKLSEHFFNDSIAVQLPLMSCINKCLVREKCLTAATLESIVKIIGKILEHDTVLFENSSHEIGILFILAVRTITTVLKSKSKLPCEWPRILQRNTVVEYAVKLVNKGLQRGAVPEFLHECMDTLIGLAQNRDTSSLVRCSDLSCNIWIPIVTYVVNVPVGEEQKWMGIYNKCFQLNTVLILTESQYYMHDAIEFWVLHAFLLSQKLDGLTYLINHCLLDPDDNAYDKITSHLDLIISGCWSVVATLPYLKEWRIRDEAKVAPLMQSLVTAVGTAASLLSSPNNLILLLTKPSHHSVLPSSSASAATAASHFKLTPELLEFQHKLWEFVSAAVNVFWKVQKDPILLHFKPVISSLMVTMKIAVKTLAKTQGEKKATPPTMVNDMEKVRTSLEKCFGTLLCRITMKLEELQQAHEVDEEMDDEDRIVEFKKEISPEITSLCEGIRTCTPEEDVLYKLCSVMDELIQIPLTSEN